jgi:hypothetical protein
MVGKTVLSVATFCLLFYYPPMPLYYDHHPKGIVTSYMYYVTSAFFLGGHRGTCTPKHLFLEKMCYSTERLDNGGGYRETP